jgi:competence protein ComEC
MKLPGLYVLPTFCVGILLAAWHPFSGGAVAACACLLFVCAAIAWRARASLVALLLVSLGWASLGALALAVEHHQRPNDLASDLVQSGKLDASQPLRWRGVLREDPETLPWGMRFDVDLDEVETFGQGLAVHGGLRASYFGNDMGPESDLRAGDRIQVLAVARIPRNFGDPGAFDYRGELARQGVQLTASVRSLELVNKLSGAEPGLRYRLARLRGLLLARIATLFAGTPQQAAVLRAMLLGDRGFVDNEISDAFRKTSSYHVLVIAGLHVAALAAFVVWVCAKLRLGRMASSFASLAALATYLGIVQDRPPILRATLMAAAYLLGRVFFRRLDILQAVALAALLILFFRPGELADSSFQLSFLAVAVIGGIALPWLDRTAEPFRHALQHLSDVTRDPGFAPRLVQFRLDLRAIASGIARRLPVWIRGRAQGIVTGPLRLGTLIWETFVISGVIQIGLMPLLVNDFHRVGFVGLFANIPAVLLTALIVPLGFFTLSLSLISTAAARLVAHLASGAVMLLLKVVTWFAVTRIGNFRVPSLPLWLIACFLAALLFLCITARAHWARAQWAAIAAVAACAIAVAIQPFGPRITHGQLELTVLDVGQGDSLFLATPDGHAMLIDGGGGPGPLRIGGVKTRFDVGEEVVSPYLWSRGLKRLDVVALTHAHEDHIEGLFAVLENFRVGELWVGHDVASPVYQQLLRLAQRRGTTVRHLERGDSFMWGEARASILWPDTTAEVRQATNDDSLALRVEYGAQAFLLTGDIEKPVERALEAENTPLSAAFLKVPHHGSATSSTEEFLRQVHPVFAAISVGLNNPFNHPAPAVVERLRAAGVQVFRTDQDGAITVTTDGKSERVATFLQAAPSPAAKLYDSLGR